MKKIIFGAGILAELMEYYLKQENSKVNKFVVEKKFLPNVCSGGGRKYNFFRNVFRNHFS